MIIGLLLCLALLLPIIPVQAASIQPEVYYGRSILSNMHNSTALLYAYDQIVAGLENVQTEIEVYNGVNSISVDEVRLVLDLCRRDYTQIFWWQGGSTIWSNSRTATKIVVSYTMSGAALVEARAKFEAAADIVLAGITPDMTEYEKELYLHDAIAEFAYYSEGTNAHNAYGALVEGVTVCEGYAEAFQYLLQRAGIQSFIVIGTGNGGGHAWNMVRIDGKYYHVDLTWNDKDDYIGRSYLNVTDSMILEDHTIDATTYTLPACTSTDAFYYNIDGIYLDSYTVEMVGKLLRDNELRIQVYFPGEPATLIDWYYNNIRNISTVAGVRTGFSYGCSYSGKEIVLYMTNIGVKVTSEQTVNYYNTMSNALYNSADGTEMKLLGNLSENVSTSLRLALDLNGYDINGSVNGANMVIYDSQTDDYTVNNGNGYGVITGAVTATVAEGYVPVTEATGYSVHKVDVALDKLVLKAESTGLYYTGSFRYDEVVAASLQSYGVTLSTENDAPVADDTDPTSLYTISGNSVLVKNIFSAEKNTAENRANAKEKIHARAYVKLQDGTILYSESKTSNLQTMVETVDTTAWTRLSGSQKTALKQMYSDFTEEMGTWNIPNLKNA